MKSSVQQRRDAILKILSQIPISTTLELAQQTNVSCETIRKDLDALSKAGVIIKVHGLLSQFRTKRSPLIKNFCKMSKIKIAKAAVRLITLVNLLF
ncbi:MAG: DeoR family transcriptional regulator [Zhenhengia sp.]